MIQPQSYAEAPDGLLLIADGINPVRRWDGLSALTELAGLAAAASGPTLAVAGGASAGEIVGTYYGYLRFVGRLGEVSNLSPISNTLTVSGSTGTVTGATNASPIVVTSAAHGLTTGDTVLISDVLGNTAANGTWTITVLTAGTFSLDTSVGNGVYTGGGTWASGVDELTYSSVAVPTDAKVARRQLLRNTNGQAQVFYVDVDTTDLVSTSFSTTNTDTDLQAEEVVALFNDKGNPLANAHGVPPSHKIAITEHLDCMFMAAEVQYDQGSVSVTNGSPTVTGIGTDWPESFEGRALYVAGATASYEISSVNTTTQVITLTSNYGGSTSPYASYAIRAQPGERRLVYYSEAGQPESWPAINALSLQEDGDEITGLMPKGSFIYILEQRHIYRFTFQSDPATDGYVFLSANRGCINHRCWAVVDESALMLDEAGVHSFTGGAESENISTPIQELWGPGRDGLKINWRARRYFHAAHSPGEQLVRFFVSLTGNYLPRHALCWDYVLKRWWIEEYPHGVGASCLGRLESHPIVFLGGPPGTSLAQGVGPLDGPEGSGGTVSGTVTGVGTDSLTDNGAVFPTSGVVGFPVFIVSGLAKGQRGIISSAAGGIITITLPWKVLPEAGDIYQIGGITWDFRTGWFRFADGDNEMARRIEVAFAPQTDGPSLLNIRLYLDRSEIALLWSTSYNSSDASGLSSEKDSADLVGDLTKTIGFLQRRLDGYRELYADGPRLCRSGYLELAEWIQLRYTMSSWMELSLLVGGEEVGDGADEG